MVFVFKDYKKKVATVTAIPMTQLDSIRDWLKYVPHSNTPLLHYSIHYSTPLPLSSAHVTRSTRKESRV